jgi:hypothetical protein
MDVISNTEDGSARLYDTSLPCDLLRMVYDWVFSAPTPVVFNIHFPFHALFSITSFTSSDKRRNIAYRSNTLPFKKKIINMSKDLVRTTELEDDEEKMISSVTFDNRFQTKSSYI